MLDNLVGNKNPVNLHPTMCIYHISFYQYKASYMLRVSGLAFFSTLTFLLLDHEILGSNLICANPLSLLNLFNTPLN